MKTLVAALVLTLSTVPAFGQILPLGITSDSAMVLMAGRYTYDTTTYTNLLGPDLHQITLGPVDFHGLAGVLILTLDRRGRVTEYAWSRFGNLFVGHRWIERDAYIPDHDYFDGIVKAISARRGRPKERSQCPGGTCEEVRWKYGKGELVLLWNAGQSIYFAHSPKPAKKRRK